MPRIPHERFQGSTSLGLRGDSIVQLDWCVGELVKTLDRLKLTDKTLIVFCSDNGPVLDDGYKDGAVEKLSSHQPAGPFSGGKYSVLEGGTRTPFITRWPGRINPGVSDQVVSTIDLAASFAALAGVNLPEAACLDSINVLPALLGETGAKGREFLVQQDNGTSGNFGLRMGDWKLVRRKQGGKTQAKVTLKPRQESKGPHGLYFLPDDPSESNDVGAANPEKLKEMIETLDSALQAPRTRKL